MPRYLPVSLRGKSAITVCARCGLKMPYNDVVQDRNVRGLWVHAECADNKDPYKLPARQPENITLQHPRPDSSIALTGTWLVTQDGFAILTNTGDNLDVG